MYEQMKIIDAFIINPPEKLSKNDMAKKVAMECVEPHFKSINMWELSSYNGGAKFKNGDTLIARITPCLENGKTAQVDFLLENEVGFGSTEYIVLRGKDNVTTNDFAYYVAISNRFREKAISSMTGSSGRQRVQLDLLSEKKVYIPPIPVQKRITNILSAFDEKIETNRKHINILNDKINSLYLSWFNDFNYPNANGELIFNDKLEREVPSDGEVMQFQDFLTPNTEKIGDTSAPIYSTTNNGIARRDDKFNKNLTKTQSNNKKVVKDDLIFGLSREILNFGVFPDEMGSVSPAYQIFKIDKQIILPFMLELEIRINMPRYMDILQLGAREGQGIRKDYLMKKYFFVPKIKIQQEFFELYETFQNKIVKLKEENVVLAEIRDTLLPKLMSGELPIEVGEE